MLVLRQLFDDRTGAYSYLLWDSDTLQAALIDPVFYQLGRELGLIDELGLKLEYVLETHVRPSHFTASEQLRDVTSAEIVNHVSSHAPYADRLVQEGDVIMLGSHRIDVIHTPGHSSNHVCYLVEGEVFTGCSLLARGCGNTRSRSGNAGQLYDSITKKLFTLPDETIVYPGRDNKGLSRSTIGEEKVYNPRLGGNRNRDAFIFIMESFNTEPLNDSERAISA